MSNNAENRSKNNKEGEAGLFEASTDVDRGVALNFSWAEPEENREKRVMGDPDARKPKE